MNQKHQTVMTVLSIKFVLFTTKHISGILSQINIMEINDISLNIYWCSWVKKSDDYVYSEGDCVYVTNDVYMCQMNIIDYAVIQ
jgi:hypothetical protein